MNYMSISKSDYMAFLKHPALLWLKKYQKYRLPEVSDTAQANFDQGHYFEEIAEKLFPEAVKLGFNGMKEYQGLVVKTTEALSKNNTILQGRFQSQNLTCIVDVLQKLDSGGYKLIEIKSSTKVKPEHEYDLAFQLYVLRLSGIEVKEISVLFVNSDYIRHGEINLQELVKEEEITSRVEELQSLTKNQIEQAQKILDSKTIPDMSVRYFNQLGIPSSSWFSEWEDICSHLLPNKNLDHILNLSYLNQELLTKFEELGITSIKDIPLDSELAQNLRDTQISQIKATISQERTIHQEKIQAFFDSLTFPLYFLDYETLACSVPFFDGMGPYKDYPFQYSLHVLDSPSAEARHYEFLHLENSDPVPFFLDSLKNHIGETGTIVSWNMSYENSCNDRMGEMYPEYSMFLKSLKERTVDLMQPFKDQWFVDYRFLGSASIKKVLPVLVPELNYADLDIGNGMKARKLWTETILEGKNVENKDKIIEDLKKYCTLDTWAMVRIYQELFKLL